MRVAVTGATGFVGRNIVREALGQGWDVRVLVREVPRGRQVLPPPVEVVAADLLKRGSLAAALEGVQALIHLVGIIHEWRGNTFERAHVETTRNLLAAAEAVGVRRYVHMSALGTRPNARSRYHQTKWAAEELVRRSALVWTIFRPSLIYGPGDHALPVLAKVIRRLPVVPVLGDGQAKIQPVSVSVVAQCFIRAIKYDHTAGRTYDLCGPVAFTWNELYDQLMDVLGIYRPKLHIPVGLAQWPAWVFEKLLRHPPFNREQLLMTSEDNTGDPGPAERDFDVQQESFALGVARYLRG